MATKIERAVLAIMLMLLSGWSKAWACDIPLPATINIVYSTLDIHEHQGVTVGIQVIGADPAATYTGNYFTANGTALGGAGEPYDYIAIGSTAFSITPQTPNRTIWISPTLVNDDTEEGDEIFYFQINNVSQNAVIGNGQCAIKILSNDPTVNVLGGNSIHEHAGGHALEFKLSKSIGYDITVPIETPPSDYTLNHSSLTYTAGQSSKIVTFTPINDTTREPDETFTVQPQTPVGKLWRRGSGAGMTIKSNDPNAFFVEDDWPVEENDSDGIAISIELDKTVQYDITIPLNFDSEGEGYDYTASGSSVYIAAGQTIGSVIATPDNDQEEEGEESYEIWFEPTLNYLGTVTSSYLRILPSDPAVSISNGGSAAVEEVDGADKVLTVSLSQAVGHSIFVPISGSPGPGTDYNFDGLNGSGQLEIPANTLSKTFKFVPINDSVEEGDESFTISIGSPTDDWGHGGTTSQQVTIKSNDPKVKLTGGGDVQENNVDGRNLTVTLSKTVGHDIDVIVTGLAGQGSQYTLHSSPVRITNGTSSNTIAFKPQNDSVEEADQSYTVSLGASNTMWSRDTGFGPYEQAVIIKANDPTVTITGGATIQENGSPLSLTVSLSRAVNYPVVVPISGGASDLELVNSVTFNPLQTTQQLTVTPVNETEEEPDKSYPIAPGSSTTDWNSGAGTNVVIGANDPRVWLSGGTSISENNQTGLQVAVNLSRTVNYPLSIPIIASPTSGTDFNLTGLSGQAVLINPNSSGAFGFIPIDDGLDEDAETINLSLGTPNFDWMPRPEDSDTDCMITDDDLPVVELIEQFAIDAQSLLRLKATVTNSGSPGFQYNFLWTVNSGSGVLEGANTSTPLYRDQTPGDGDTEIGLAVTRGGDQTQKTVDIDVHGWSNARYSGFANVNGAAGGAVDIEMARQYLNHAVTGVSPFWDIVWSASAGGNPSIYENSDGVVSIVNNGAEALLGSAGDEESEILLSWGTDGKFFSRIRQAGAPGGWGGVTKSELGLVISNYPAQQPLGLGASAGAARHGTAWNAAITDEQTPQTPTVRLFQYGGQPMAWTQAISFQDVRLPSLVSGNDGRLYLVMSGEGETIRVQQSEVSGAWNAGGGETLTHAHTTCMAIKDARGNLIVLTRQASGKISVLVKKWNGSAYGSWTTASTDLLSPETIDEPAHLSFAAAEPLGGFYIVGHTTAGLKMVRGEVDEAGAVSVSPVNHQLTKRSVAGDKNKLAKIKTDARGRGLATWVPSLVSPQDSLYIAAREYHYHLELEEDRTYTVRRPVRVAWSTGDPTGDDVQFYGTDVTDVTLNNNSQGSATYFAHDSNNELRVVLSAAPHGFEDDVGRQSVIGRRKIGGVEDWPVWDSIVYVDDSDFSITGLEITALPGGPPISSTVLGSVGIEKQFHLDVEYQPSQYELLFEYGDFEWGVTNRLGTISAGLFGPAKLGYGEVVAARSADLIEDRVRVEITGTGLLHSIEILPADDVIVGLKEQVRFTAVGKDVGGNPIDFHRVWSVEGAGEISQSGFYSSPSSFTGGIARIVVHDREQPEAVRSSKTIRIDGQAPMIDRIEVNDADPEGDLLPGGEVSNAEGQTVTISWAVAATPEEISPPVSYRVILSGRHELGEIIGSADPDVIHSLEWDSRTVPNGDYTIAVVATDRVGNSNGEVAQTVAIRVANDYGSILLPQSGQDWLLLNQNRTAGPDLGSWKNATARPNVELIAEATFALQTIAGLPMDYRTATAHPHDGKPAAVAQAYHDGIVWLGGQMEGGNARDFALKCMIVETLAAAKSRRGEIGEVIGGVSMAFDRALSLADEHINGEPPLLNLLLEDGGFAQGEESLSTRFETLLALRAAAAKGDDKLLQSLLPKMAAYFGGEQTLVETAEALGTVTRNYQGGWANTPWGAMIAARNHGQPAPATFTALHDDVFYLTAEIGATLHAIGTKTGFSGLKPWVNDSVLVQEMVVANQDSSGLFPAGAANVVDSAAGLNFLVQKGLGGASAGGLMEKIVSASSAIKAEQQENGSWNGRPLDTAWAQRVLRAELVIGEPATGAIFRPENRTFNVRVENRGALAASAVRVSLFSKDPRSMTPGQRVKEQLALSHSHSIPIGGSAEISMTIPDGAIPGQIYLMADASQQIAEYDDRNNILEWRLPAEANLVVFAEGIKAKGTGIVPVAGKPFTISVEVMNLGRQAVSLTAQPAPRLELYINHPYLNPNSRLLLLEDLDERFGTVLEAGGRIKVDFAVDASRYEIQSPAEYEVYAWIDPPSGKGRNRGEIFESNETDNLAGKTITVYEETALTGPDLTIAPDGVSYEPTPFYAEAGGRLNVRIDNIGTGTANPSRLSVSIDPLQQPMTFGVPLIPGGRSSVIEIPLVLEAPEVTLELKADAGNSVPEVSEENNEASITVVVNTGPNAALFDLGIRQDDIEIVRDANGIPWPRALIRNLLSDIPPAPAKTSDITFRYWGAAQNGSVNYLLGPNPPFTFVWQKTRLQQDDQTDLATLVTPADKVVKVEADLAELSDEENPSFGEYSIANNIARRTFDLRHTNLRLLELSASPAVPLIAGAGEATARFNLNIVVANGDGDGSFEEAAPVHLRVYDEVTRRELGYWNNLTVKPLNTTGVGSSNQLTVQLPNVELEGGLHSIIAVIDANRRYVETDETDNDKSLTLRIDDPFAAGRVKPDLTLTGADVRLHCGEAAAAPLLVEAAIRHVDRSAGVNPPLAARDFEVAVYLVPESGPEVEISTHRGFVSYLAHGAETKVIIPTSLTNQSIENDGGNTTIRIVVDPANTIIEDEPGGPYESNNSASLSAERPAPPTDFKAYSFFSVNTCEWELPIQEPVGAANFELTRSLASEPAEIEKSWNLAADSTRHVDEDPQIAGHTLYEYRIRTLGTNGRFSPWVSAQTQTEVSPRILSVGGVPTDDPLSVLVLANAAVNIECSYPTETPTEIKLVVNGKTRATITPTDESFNFPNFALTETYNRIQLIGHKSSGGSGQYTAYSNTVIVVVDKDPDLRAERNSEGPWIGAIWAQGTVKTGAFRVLEDPRTFAKCAGNRIRFQIYVENLKEGIPVQTPFSVLFSVEYKDNSAPVQSVVWVYDEVIEDEGGVFVESGDLVIDSGKEIKQLRVKIDYDAAVPHGRIIESSEINNTCYLVPFKYESNFAKEYWFPVPFEWDGPRYHQAWWNSHFTTFGEMWRTWYLKYANIQIQPATGTPGNTSVSFYNYRGFDSGFNFAPWDNLAWWRTNWNHYLFERYRAFFHPQYWASMSPSTLNGSSQLIGSDQVFNWFLPYTTSPYSFRGAQPEFPRPQFTEESTAAYSWDLEYSGMFGFNSEFLYTDNSVRVLSDKPIAAQYGRLTAGDGYRMSLTPRGHLGSKYVIASHAASEVGFYAAADLPHVNYAYFMAMATEDFTDIRIFPNCLGVPASHEMVKATLQADGAYHITLNKGQSYVWKSKNYYSDPTGVVVESTNPNRKISVVSGSNAAIPATNISLSRFQSLMPPPLEHMGTEYVLPPAPLASDTNLRNTPFNSKNLTAPSQDTSLAGPALNRFIRIVATTNSTLVTVLNSPTGEPNPLQVTLQRGEWMEIGENTNQYPLVNYVETREAGRAPLYRDRYSQLIKKFPDTRNRTYLVRSNKPTMAITYYVPAQGNAPVWNNGWKDFEIFRWSKPSEGSGFWYGNGNSAIVQNYPTAMYSTERLIPISLFGMDMQNPFKPYPLTNYEKPDKTYHNAIEELYIRHEAKDVNYHWVTLIAKDPDPSVVPEVYLSNSPGVPGLRVDQIQGLSGYKSYWEPISFQDLYQGCKTITFQITDPYFDYSRHENSSYFIENVSKIPLSVIVSTAGRGKATAYNAAYQHISQTAISNPLVDLEVEDDTSIRILNSENKLILGQVNPLRFEIFNNGSADVATGTARITVRERVDDSWQTIVNEIPINQVIQMRRSVPCFVEFHDYIPDPACEGLQVTVTHTSEADATNNTATREFDWTGVLRPDLQVEFGEPLPNGITLTREYVPPFDPPARLRFTVVNRNLALTSAALRVDVKPYWKRESPTPPAYSIDTAVEFTPDSIITSEPGYYLARKTVTVDIPTTITTYYQIKAVVDAPQLVAETNESNNWMASVNFQADVRYGNLALQNMTNPPVVAVGTPMTVGVDLTNDDVRDIKNATVQLFLGDPADPDAVELDRIVVDSIQKNQSLPISLLGRIDYTGTYPLAVRVSPGGLYDRNDATHDNTIVRNVRVIDAFKPDLTITDLSRFTVPAEIEIGQSAPIFALIENAGFEEIDKPYRVTVIDDHASLNRGRIIAEKFINIGSGVLESNRISRQPAAIQDLHSDSVEWQDPANASGSDDWTAHLWFEEDLQSSTLQADNFAFAVPSGKTIKGIEVHVEYQGSWLGFFQDSLVSLVDENGVIAGANRATAELLPGDYGTIMKYGSPTDLWGLEWTPEKINDTDFGVAISLEALEPYIDVGIDDIRIEVYYEDVLGTQTPGESLEFSDTWDTSTADLGEHTVYFMIDSAEHLAASGKSDFLDHWPGAPLLTGALDQSAGIQMVNPPGGAQNRHWRVDVFNARSATDPTTGSLIGRWDSRLGFIGGELDANGVPVHWGTASTSPVLLIFDTFDGQPLPAFAKDSWQMHLTVSQAQGAAQTAAVELTLPGNEHGTWGNRLGLWVADDGSTYFARSTHFDALPEGEPGAPFDLSPSVAIGDPFGAVDELNELNNIFSRKVNVVEPSVPDFNVAFCNIQSTKSLVGQIVPLRVMASNRGRNIFEAVSVSLSVRAAGSQDPWVVIDNLSILGGLMNGESKFVDLTWTPGSTLNGFFEMVAQVNPGNVIPELNHEDNSATLVQEILPSLAVSIEDVAAAYLAGADVPIEITIVADEGATSATLYAEIVSVANGQVIDQADLGDSTPMRLHGTAEISRLWNTGTQKSGEYYFRIRIHRLGERREEVHPPIVATSNPFSILPDKRVDSRVTADKPVYQQGEPVTLKLFARNQGLNYDFAQLRYSVDVMTRGGTVIWRYEPAKAINVLPVAASWSGQATWPSPATSDIHLTARLRLFDENGYTTESLTSFIYGDRPQMFGIVNVLDSMGQGIHYTSQTAVQLNLQPLTTPALAGSGFVVLSDSPIYGPGLFSRNLMKNAGFERLHASEPDVPEHWSDQWTENLSEFVVAQAFGVGNSRALKLVGSSGSWAASLGGDSRVANSEGVSLLTLIDSYPAMTLSFYYYLPGTGTGLYPIVIERNAQGEVIGTHRAALRHSTVGQWTRGDLRFMPQRDTVGVGVKFELSGSGEITAYLDNLQIEAGTASSTWVDPSGLSEPGRSLNLLVNGSLTIDAQSTLTLLANSALEPATDQQGGNSIPDGWHAQVTGGTWTLGDEKTEARLLESGLSHEFKFAPGGGTETFNLRQGRIPIDSDHQYVFSVYAAGSSTLTLRIEQYDAAQVLISSATHAADFELATELTRHATAFTATADAKTIAVELESEAAAPVFLAAAQLEPGDTPRAWVGWVPYLTGTPWTLKNEATEGEKAAYVQFADKAGRISQKPSVNLLGSGAFANIDQRTTATIHTEAGQFVIVNSGTLFDGSTQIMLPSSVPTDRISLEFEPAGSGDNLPVISDILLHFVVDPPMGSMVSIEAAMTNGEWALAAELPATGRLLAFENLALQFNRYRIIVEYGAFGPTALSEVQLFGQEFSGRDSVVYDITPPELEFQFPGSDGQSLAPDGITAVVSVEDNLAGVRNAQLRVNQGGEQTEWLEMSRTGANEFTVRVDLAPALFGDGSATMSVRAWDQAGNLSEIITRSFIIDSQPPALSNARFSRPPLDPAAWFKNADPMELRVHVVDQSFDASGVLADLREFGLSADEPASATLDPNEFVWVLTDRLADAAEGELSVEIRAVDLSGNESESLQATAIIDRTPPTVSLAPPFTTPVRTSSIVLYGIAEDLAPGIIVAIEYQLDSGPWLEADPNDGNLNSGFERYAVRLEDLSQGTHVVTVRAYDAAGNVSDPMAIRSFDVAVPAPPIILIENLSTGRNDFVKDGDVVIIEAIFESEAHLVRGSHANLSPLGGSAAAAPSYLADERTPVWEVLEADLPTSNGIALVHATGVDGEGRRVSGNAGINLDNVAPWSVLQAGIPAIVTTHSLAIDGIAHDLAPGRIALIEYRLNGQEWTTATLVTAPYDDATTESFSISLSGLPDGLHVVEIRVADVAGNIQSDHLTSATIRIDTAFPVILDVFVMDLTTSSSEFISDGHQGLIIAEFDSATIQPGDQISADLTGLGGAAAIVADSITTGTLITSAVWLIDEIEAAPEDGTVGITVKVIDEAQQQVHKTQNILADNQTPDTTLEMPASITNPIRLTGTASDAAPGRIAGVQYRVGNEDWLDAWPDSSQPGAGFDSGSEAYQFVFVAPPGTQTIQARAIDAAGHVDPSPATIELNMPAILSVFEVARLMGSNRPIGETPAPPVFFRNGSRLQLQGILNPHVDVPTTDSMHANLSGFGLGSNVEPDLIVENYAFWNLDDVSADPADGLTTATIWTDADPARFRTAWLVADNTSPTVTMDVLGSIVFSTSSLYLKGTASDTVTSPGAPYQISMILATFDGITTPVQAFSLEPGDAGPTQRFGIITPDLPEGTHNLDITAFDAVGNSSSTSMVVVIDFDASPVTDVVVTDLDLPAPLSSTYLRNGHRVEIRARLTDASIRRDQIHADLSAIGLGADALPNEYDGIHARWTTVTLQTDPNSGLLDIPVWVDRNGTISGETGHITADNTPPTIEITEQIFVTEQSRIFRGTAGDSHSGLAAMHIRLDSQPWQPSPLFDLETGEFEFGFDDLSDGSHQVQMLAWDKVGNVSTTHSLEISVELVGPIVVIDSPTSTTWTNQSIQLHWIAPSNDVATSVGTLQWTALGDSSTTATFNVADGQSITTEGTYLLAVYGLNSENVDGPTTMTTFGIDRRLPTELLWVDSPTSTTVSVVQGSAADGAGESGLADIQVQLDSTGWISAETLDPQIGSYWHVFDGISEGIHVIWSRSLDRAGNVSNGTSATLVVDLTPPSIELAPYQPDPTGETTLTYSGWTTDTLSGVAAVQIRKDQGEWMVAQLNLSHSAFSHDIDGLSNGTHTIEARAFDAAGNFSTIDSDTVIVDLIGPQITIVEPTAGSTKNGAFTIRADVSDNIAGVAAGGVEYLFQQPGETWQPLPLTSGTFMQGSYSKSIDSWSLIEGPVALTVRASDQVGNNWDTSIEDDNSETVNLSIDNDYPPQRPTGLTAAYVSFTQLRLTWNKNTDPDLDHYVIYSRSGVGVSIDETTTSLVLVSDDATTAPFNVYIDSVTTSTATSQNWNYALKAVDKADNISALSNTISVLPPDTPDNLRAIGLNGQVQLDWHPVGEGYVKGYYIYRATGTTPGTFALQGTVLGRQTVNFTDNTVTNGNTYWYYVQAFDGAHNTSQRTFPVKALPNPYKRYDEEMLIVFEDKVDSTIDWDFTDLGAIVKTSIYLVDNDKVSTVTIEAIVSRHDSSAPGYDMDIAIQGVIGSGTYRGTVYNGNGSVKRQIPAHAYLSDSPDKATQNMPLFRNVAGGGNDKDIVNDRAVLTLTIDHPTSNPLSGFDKPPFDVWMNIPSNPQAVYHIFDPFDPEGKYEDHAVLVTNDPIMQGVYLNNGLVIRKLDWESPQNKKKIWIEYPKFVDFAKSYRTNIIRNVDWYE